MNEVTNHGQVEFIVTASAMDFAWQDLDSFVNVEFENLLKVLFMFYFLSIVSD